MSIDASKVQWDAAPKIDVNAVKWDGAPQDDTKSNEMGADVSRSDVSQPKKELPNLELTWAEKNLANLLPKFLGNLAGGNIRGSAAGRLAMGAADPGVAIAQIAANLAGKGDAVNNSIADTEKQYQSARNSAGSDGFDPLRLAGGVAITLPAGGLVGGAAKSLPTTAVRGALQGAGFAALQPVSGGENFAEEKAKQMAIGGVTGGIAAPVIASLAKIINPSVNPNVKILQDAGVRPTFGQAAGGFVDRLEEKAQSLPFLGDAIRSARKGVESQVEEAAFRRVGDPIGASIKGGGSDAILKAKDALSASYDKVIPRLSVNVTDPAFVGRISNLRKMVGSLPQQERDRFDAIIAREIDERLAPNGVLSGQNLKDAWMALRDQSAKLLKSNDAYQNDLGAALKQTFNELKSHVAATNSAVNVRDLRNTDLAYANYKILQKAASSANAVDGHITPSNLHAAVRASDRSLDKGRMAEGKALMQDLSGAAKDVVSNKFPNSGTFDRAIMGGLVLGAPLAPHISLPIAGGLLAGAGMYSQPVQNALVALLTKRPDMAPKIAELINKSTSPAIAATAMSQQ